MEIVLGCVGKPSAGKSTFFNGVSEGKAKTGNFPFTTIEPNVGISYYRVDCPCVRKVRRARTHGTHGRGETCHREGNPHGICRCGVLFVVAGEVYCTPHESDKCTHLPLPCLSFPVFPSPLTYHCRHFTPRARRRSVRPSTGGATGSGVGSSR